MNKIKAEEIILGIYRQYLIDNYTYDNGRGYKRNPLEMLGQTCVKYEHQLKNPGVPYSENNPEHKVFGHEKNKDGFLIARPLRDDEGIRVVEELLEYKLICFIMDEAPTSFGSCWSPDIFSLAPTISLEDEGILDNIVEQVAPDLSFIKYKRMKSILSATEVYEPEYYSDGTYYKIGIVSVEKLAQYLTS